MLRKSVMADALAVTGSSPIAMLDTNAYSKPNQSTIPKQTSPPFQSKPVQHSEANQSTCFRLNT